MKKIFYTLLCGLAGLFAACDEIDEADRYIEMPVVESRRAVLLEEFTDRCAPTVLRRSGASAA